jgi:hypothetical protein
MFLDLEWDCRLLLPWPYLQPTEGGAGLGSGVLALGDIVLVSTGDSTEEPGARVEVSLSNTLMSSDSSSGKTAMSMEARAEAAGELSVVTGKSTEASIKREKEAKNWCKKL